MKFIKNLFKSKSNKVKEKKGIKYHTTSLAIALGIAILVRSFIVQSSYIPSGSMKPTLLEGDYLFVTKFNYGYTSHSLPFSIPIIPESRIFYSAPERGDVIVFKYPADKRTDYVKRLIGLPGDKIEIRSGVVYINDAPVHREYIGLDELQYFNETINVVKYKETLPNGVSYTTYLVPGYYNESRNMEPVIVPEDSFFAMGDNRDMSRDSRFADVSFIDKSLLLGKASFIFFSIDGYFLQVWKWFTEIRFDRIFTVIK